MSNVHAAWARNVSAGTGYRFREAIESETVNVEDHSNFSIALALQAGSMGNPYLPPKSLLGSDILERIDLVTTTDPFTDVRIVLVPVIELDWALVHIQPPGVEVADVIDDFPGELRTAEDVGAGSVTTTPEPTSEELELVRTFDPDEFWT